MSDALTAIAAVARNGVIGVDGALPWHIPEDMRHFKRTTMGAALVVGRATYESFGAHPLPGRMLFVVSRRVCGGPSSCETQDPASGDSSSCGTQDPVRSVGTSPGDSRDPDCVRMTASGQSTVTWCASVDDAITAARATGRTVFVAGGEQVYRAAWPLITDLDLTLVDAEPDGDRHFPRVDPAEWEETFREPHDGFAFVRYRRRP